MKTLVENGLWGAGLFTVNTPELASRYNACLADMDIAPTRLQKFQIDATGWSPEIAAEKGKRYYLSLGEANLLAIILSPQQRNCTIWNPFHSFDRELIARFFDNYSQQIAAITERDGIWLDIDQEIDSYHHVDDLLFVDHIIIRAYTPTRLMKEAEAQRALMREFMDAQDDFLSEAQTLLELPTKLKDSIDRVGDIAHKSVVIPDTPFAVPPCFFTRAFGGTFVLRGATDERVWTLGRDVAYREAGVRSTTDRTILKRLDTLDLISYNVSRWLNELPRLSVIRDSFLMDALDVVMPELNYVELTAVQKKGVLNRPDVMEALPEEYSELNTLIRSLERNKVPKKIPTTIKPYLAHPHETLQKSTKEVVWHVLSMVCDGRDTVRLYRYDKEIFYSVYETKWKKPWRTFAVDCIQKYHNRYIL